MAALVICMALATPLFAQTIDSSRGIDVRVDYPSLVEIGPWDDRNYSLTQEDLDVLADNEKELSDPVPAFFRVLMRRNNPDMLREGPAQYPRSALQIFQQMYGGYLIDGNVYTKINRVDGKYVVDMATGTDTDTFYQQRALSGESRVTSPIGAAESAVKINPVDTNIVIAGSNGPGGGQKMHRSTDGGVTWNEILLPLGGTCCDPTVDWSADGSLAYASTLGSCGAGGCSVWVYRSDDGGASWNGLENATPGDPRRELTNGGSDKEFLHVDQSATSPYKDNVYLTWHDSNVLKFSVSSNDGNSWSTQAFSSLTADRGIGSDITTDAAGNIYYIWPTTSSRRIKFVKSTNGGVSFGPISEIAVTQASFIFPLPSINVREAFVYAAADTDRSNGLYAGSVYAAWTDNTNADSSTPSANHGRIQVGYSRDGGNSWSVTTPHETADSNSVDRWHPWLAVGVDGTVHVVFYDTRRDPSRTSVDLFYSFSTDGAQSWSAPQQVTTVISPSLEDSFEFGDYNGLDVVLDSLIAVYTDNRHEGGGTSDSPDVYAIGIPVSGGGECGNNTAEPGEGCDGTDLRGQTCGDFGCSGGSLACLPDCSAVDTSACTGCPICDNNGVCDPGEDCNTCPGDCVSGSTSGAICGNGVCEIGNGEDCLSCSADCNGRTGGRPSNRYCCGDGAGPNPMTCTDAVCTDNGASCTTTPVTGGSFCCGDATCDEGEDCSNCALDCGGGLEVCGNGADDDCDLLVDCADPDCIGGTEVCGNGQDDDCNGQIDCDDSVCSALPACLCAPVGDSCTVNSDCCGNKCRGPSGNKSCK